MLVFAHVGITLGLARSLEYLIHKGKDVKPSQRFDYRLVAVGSMLPDIIDKPLSGLILSETAGGGRIYAHTLLFLLLVLIAAVFYWRINGNKSTLLVAGAVFVHDILDSMWLFPKIICWPLYGWGFNGGNPKTWVHFWWTELLHNPYVYIPEAVGCVIIIIFLYKIFSAGTKEFVLTGKLQHPPYSG
jgi:membrane-bound metal-dependent hydrolase YbcI (DUF457 family)